MRLTIETDGDAAGTTVSIDGRPVDVAALDFSFSHIHGSRKAKLGLVVHRRKGEASPFGAGPFDYYTLYGSDFRVPEELKKAATTRPKEMTDDRIERAGRNGRSDDGERDPGDRVAGYTPAPVEPGGHRRG